MATYNWKYKSGSLLPTGQAVAVSADNVRPSNACYVALFGNDISGNGSRILPYKTIAKAVSINTNHIIIASGTYREAVAFRTNIIGDGDVIIDGYTLDTAAVSGANCTIMGITLRYYIFNISGGSARILSDCIVENCSIISVLGSSTLDSFTRCSFYNTLIRNTLQQKCVSCTFVRCSIVKSEPPTAGGLATHKENIYYNCNIRYEYNPSMIKIEEDFCIFFYCNFRVVAFTEITYPIQFYPLIPSGYTYINNLASLQITILPVFINQISVFDRSIFTDPKFNNLSIRDYSLAFDSPAKNLSYFGTFIGAYSIGYSIKIMANEEDGDLDFSTNQNFIIEDNSLSLDDEMQDAEIQTKVQINSIGREYDKLSSFGTFADRNGQYIDSIEDLSSTTIPAGTDLAEGAPYIVEVAAIVYNGYTILPGERFTTITGVLSFTSIVGGLCREILEAPQRHTIEARFSDGGDVLTSGDPLTEDWWYYVTGIITYNGIDYTDRMFKAVDTNSFTGTGLVIEAMKDEEFNHFEPRVSITSNNVGDVRNGAIICGNGDPDYERGAGKEFAMNYKFWQFRLMVMHDNLNP